MKLMRDKIKNRFGIGLKEFKHLIFENIIKK